MTSACRGWCLRRRMLRSPYAHAKNNSIDTSAALALPGVAAVITAKDLETLGLAWMPTISYDTQAVLAGDKVRFQGQEVAFVIATDEYIARDALPLIEVDYEPLPVVVDARKALDPDAPLIRDDKDGQTDATWRRRRGRRPVMKRPPIACSPRPTSSPRGTSSTRAATRPRWRRAA